MFSTVFSSRHQLKEEFSKHELISTQDYQLQVLVGSQTGSCLWAHVLGKEKIHHNSK